jgi:hypothetical protein
MLSRMPESKPKPKSAKDKPLRDKVYLTLAADVIELLNAAKLAEDLPLSRIVDRCVRQSLGKGAKGA